MRGFQHIGDRIVDVAFEYHGCVSVNLVTITSEAARRHVILQNLHGTHVFKAHACHFIKRNAIPMAHQAEPCRAARIHATKQVRRSGLAARQQNRVGRHLFVDMAFARTARAKLAQVIIALHKRHHALDEMQALALGEHIRLVTSRAQKHIHPFVAREVLPLFDKPLQIQIWHLDWREAHHRERRIGGRALLFRRFLLRALIAEHVIAKSSSSTSARLYAMRIMHQMPPCNIFV